MRPSIAPWVVALALVSRPAAIAAQSRDSLELVRLEAVWNQAHVSGDTVALRALWAPEFGATVPAMPRMSRAELLRFWRSGRSAISRYETDSVAVWITADAAIVTGHLRRERSFNGRAALDDWLFTKTYLRREGQWQVIAYHASAAPR